MLFLCVAVFTVCVSVRNSEIWRHHVSDCEGQLRCFGHFISFPPGLLDALGQTWDILKGLYFPAVLGRSRHPPEDAQHAATVTRRNRGKVIHSSGHPVNATFSLLLYRCQYFSYRRLMIVSRIKWPGGTRVSASQIPDWWILSGLIKARGPPRWHQPLAWASSLVTRLLPRP